MDQAVGTFDLQKQEGEARAGRLKTARGWIETPVFMPVGTKATVKGMLPEELRSLGAQVVLATPIICICAQVKKRFANLGGCTNL